MPVSQWLAMRDKMTIKLFKTDIVEWVRSTVSKADSGMEWRDAWSESYFQLGGKSQSNSIKACPLNGTKTLYEFGRIKGQKNNQKLPLLNKLGMYLKTDYMLFWQLKNWKKILKLLIKRCGRRFKPEHAT